MRTFLRTDISKKVFGIATLALVTLSACGGVVEYGELAAQNKFGPVNLSPPSPSPVLPPSIPITPAPQTEPGQQATELSPVYEFNIQGVGYSSSTTPSNGAQTITVKANKKLKIRFKPAINERSVVYTSAYGKTYSYVPAYSKLGVYINVGTTSQPTPLLNNGHFSGQAEISPIMDYSGTFTNSCAADDSACRVTVTITVYKANSDHYQITYGTGGTHSRVYSTHPWGGTLYVSTDDTGDF